MNLKIRKIITGFSLVVMVGMIAGCGSADRVGTVDMNQVMEKAPAAQKIKKDIENKENQKQQELIAAKSQHSPAEYQKKEQQVQQEMQIYATSMQRQFQAQLESQLAGIAKEKKVGIVVYKEAAPQGGIDVTPEVIAKLQ